MRGESSGESNRDGVARPVHAGDGLTAEAEDHQSVRRMLPQLTPEETAELSRIVRLLAKEFRPERIYVFGSQARGTATPDSDVDLLVVVPATNEPTYRLSQRAYGVIGPHRLPLDILFMSRDEFDWRTDAVTSLPATVVREGRVLYAA
jgi:uncharacterized protein